MRRFLPAGWFLLALCAPAACPSDGLRAQEVQPTPSVLLPEKYLENVRAPLEAGSAAPEFALERCSLDRSEGAREIRLSQWRDEKTQNGVVIVFWAFWCDTWKDMTRDLSLLRAPLQEMKLQVLAVSVDASQQPVARRAFETRRIWWPVVIDEKSQVSAQWGVRRVPTVFVLDKNGKIKKVYEGFPGKQTFLRETAGVLGLKVPVTSKPVK